MVLSILTSGGQETLSMANERFFGNGFVPTNPITMESTGYAVESKDKPYVKK